MRRAWALGAALAALVGAGLALAQETQPSAQPAPTPPEEAASTPADAPPPEEAAPAPPLPRAPVAETAAEPDGPPPPPPPPLQRPRFAAAILQGVDKITAETIRFEARVGEPVRYRGVVLTVHACETTASDEPVFDSWAHLDVVSQARTAAGSPAASAKPVFRGWMSADSQSLHPFESAGYDLWLIACRTAAPGVPVAGQT